MLMWKARMILNYKGIDYETEWVEYPDLAPTFKSFGLPPNNKDGVGYFAEYTSPSVKFGDGTYCMDSWKIAIELEKRYPSPSLHIDDPIVVQVRNLIPEIMGPLQPNIIPKVPRMLLNPPSVEYFERTRKERYGMSLSQVEEDRGGEPSWKAAEQPINEIADLLKKKGGPFFLGKTVSYADLIFVSFLHFLKRLDKGVFERFLSFDTAFSTIYDASKEWLAKDD
ncbi:uncharacterized protein BDR25DRAFT_333615 [Lindgomyces ingoldianus]|uniref:Uncharacterized protein n=1 Tax=Lindgomyces ingoldianus TaxID=673940 RepID=A0ACB6QYZ1_9PLEO|nr:uncharacterized protein BDR25DRAFT_333615 [Lindgomyces ingoldianus]KAF2472248.1 hypothetical protein BDR25DRAFT_333615 [Lindgomyces ingoldianus]